MANDTRISRFSTRTCNKLCGRHNTVHTSQDVKCQTRNDPKRNTGAFNLKLVARDQDRLDSESLRSV